MKWLLLALAVAAVLSVANGGPPSVKAQQIVTCDVDSSDWPIYNPDVFGGNYGFQAHTQCPVTMNFVSAASWVQKAQFTPTGGGSWQRTSDFPFEISARFLQKLAMTDGELIVMPYFGLNCRRVLTLHAAQIDTSVLQTRWTFSTGECF